MSLTLTNSTTGKKYIFNTTTNINLSKDFNIINLTLPGGETTSTIATSLLGVTGLLDLTVEITPRTDDYTDGTYTGGGDPPDNDIYTEMKWLFYTVCALSGKNHTLASTTVDYTWNVCISNINMPILGEAPNKIIGNLQLMEHAPL